MKLGCGAAMSYLRRTRAGAYTINEALSLEDIISAADSGRAEGLLKPVDSLFRAYPKLIADSAQERIIKNGGSFKASDTDKGKYRLFSLSGEFLALAEAENGLIKTIKSFYEI
jgi:tRNA pseudouridine55 synthase